MSALPDLADARIVENEKTTRKQRIDHQLARAGWGKGSLSFVEEFLLKDSEIRDPTTPYIAGDDFVDYTLPDASRRPLAIVEAKKSSRNALEGERQAADYADRIKQALWDAFHGTGQPTPTEQPGGRTATVRYLNAQLSAQRGQPGAARAVMRWLGRG